MLTGAGGSRPSVRLSDFDAFVFDYILRRRGVCGFSRTQHDGPVAVVAPDHRPGNVRNSRRKNRRRGQYSRNFRGPVEKKTRCTQYWTRRARSRCFTNYKRKRKPSERRSDNNYRVRPVFRVGRNWTEAKNVNGRVISSPARVHTTTMLVGVTNLSRSRYTERRTTANFYRSFRYPDRGKTSWTEQFAAIRTRRW